jgi:hypothetical protein
MFLNWILNNYNTNFDDLFVLNCKCTKNQCIDYDSLIKSPKTDYSYTICFKLSDNQIGHKLFPVMFGSNIDQKLRKNSKLFKSHYGAFLIRGEIKIFTNILLNNVCTYVIAKQNSRLFQGPQRYNWPMAINTESAKHLVWTYAEGKELYFESVCINLKFIKTCFK